MCVCRLSKVQSPGDGPFLRVQERYRSPSLHHEVEGAVKRVSVYKVLEAVPGTEQKLNKYQLLYNRMQYRLPQVLPASLLTVVTQRERRGPIFEMARDSVKAPGNWSHSEMTPMVRSLGWIFATCMQVGCPISKITLLIPCPAGMGRPVPFIVIPPYI